MFTRKLIWAYVQAPPVRGEGSVADRYTSLAYRQVVN